MNKYHYLLIGLGAAAVTFYLAGAVDNTGIYASPVGNILYKTYNAGYNVAAGTPGVTA